MDVIYSKYIIHLLNHCRLQELFLVFMGIVSQIQMKTIQMFVTKNGCPLIHFP